MKPDPEEVCSDQVRNQPAVLGLQGGVSFTVWTAVELHYRTISSLRSFGPGLTNTCLSLFCAS